MERLGITMPTRTAAMERFPEYARWADEAGFDSVWDYEIYRNPFAMLCTAALTTRRATLATGLAAAFPRSPFEAANAAADVDELSDGRMLIGLGTGVPEFLRAFHSQGFEKPVARMRDYIECMRRSWQYLSTGEAEPYRGAHYQFAAPPLNPWGLRPLPRERIPIYLASMAPMMTRLAGELADGWMAYLATPKWIAERARPLLAEGAARSGRDVDDLGIAAEVICSVSPDRDVAYRRGRIHTGFYVCHPVSSEVIALHGLEAERDAVRDALMTKGLEGLAETSDRLVETFSITGTAEEARHKLEDWKVAIPHVVLHTPYVPPLATEESEDAYRQIVDAFSRTGTTSGASPNRSTVGGER
jgi:probable F420-dependent oxidoreductase